MPWCASATVSSLAVGSGRVDAVTVTTTVPSTGSVSPSSIRTVSVACVPFGVAESALTWSVWPSIDALSPAGAPPTIE